MKFKRWEELEFTTLYFSMSSCRCIVLSLIVNRGGIMEIKEELDNMSYS